MPDPKRPMDLLAFGLAAALALLALLQWRGSARFAGGAETTTATVVELRRTKKTFLEGRADVFATVEFTPAGAEAPTRAELPTPLRTLGLPDEGLEGTTLVVRYDPSNPRVVRFASSEDRSGALVLLALAVGALFVPAILRRSSLSSGFG